jgi:hypothetical protein
MAAFIYGQSAAFLSESTEADFTVAALSLSPQAYFSEDAFWTSAVLEAVLSPPQAKAVTADTSMMASAIVKAFLNIVPPGFGVRG